MTPLSLPPARYWREGRGCSSSHVLKVQAPLPPTASPQGKPSLLLSSTKPLHRDEEQALCKSSCPHTGGPLTPDSFRPEDLKKAAPPPLATPLLSSQPYLHGSTGTMLAGLQTRGQRNRHATGGLRIHQEGWAAWHPLCPTSSPAAALSSGNAHPLCALAAQVSKAPSAGCHSALLSPDASFWLHSCYG